MDDEEIRDRAVLDALAEAGSNMDKPHSVEYLLYLPTEQSCESAAAMLRDLGFDVDVEKPMPDHNPPTSWGLFATKSVVPKWTAIREITTMMERIAIESGGVYDGWGAQGVLGAGS